MGRTFDSDKDILKKLDDIAAALNPDSSDVSVDFEHTKNYDYGEDYVAALEKIENAIKSGISVTPSADQVSVDDADLAYEADNVQEAFEKVIKTLTYAEYEALTEEEKNNGTLYFITDADGV